MCNRLCDILFLGLSLAVGSTLFGCTRAEPPGTITMVIESSPANLDPRIGTDAQSEHIDSLIFDALVQRDAHFNIQPWLAQSWEMPDPLTYIFHLRAGVHFHDGRPLTSKDVQWTIASVLNGSIPTVKSQAFRNVSRVDAPDPLTVVFHLKQPDYALLPSLSNGAIGIVPVGSGRDFGRHPIGSGPFRFVSQEQDKEVVIERNPSSWMPPATLARVRFAVVPDSITRALELQKGSADVGVNALTADQLYALRDDSRLVVESGPGTILNYISFNTRDPLLKDVRVRRAIACAINRPLIIHALWRDRARTAESLLPRDHWAWTGEVQTHPYDPAAANALLDAAGLKRGRDGVRFHLTIKTSTDETGRTLAVVLQQELREVGIALEVRSFEFATFYADIAKGAFQMYTLRWLGGNEDPDIFRYAHATQSFPPHGANRGYYSNPALDALIAKAAVASSQDDRTALYAQIQKILAIELPAINLWYLDTAIVHNRRLHNVTLSSSGTYVFCVTPLCSRDRRRYRGSSRYHQGGNPMSAPVMTSGPLLWPPASAARDLQSDEVHVWAWTFDPSREPADEDIRLLDDRERRRTARFKFAPDRLRYSVCHAATRRILGGYLRRPPESLAYREGARGKPSLVLEAGEAPLRFNLSHSKTIALLAVALGREVGVDVENVRPIEPGVALRFFSPAENAAMASLPGQEWLDAFYRCWTRKEAILKVEGVGLHIELASFDVSVTAGEAAALLGARPEANLTAAWQLHHLAPAPGVMGALAVEDGWLRLSHYSYPAH